jgi:hypothetical protein
MGEKVTDPTSDVETEVIEVDGSDTLPGSVGSMGGLGTPLLPDPGRPGFGL